MGQPNSTVEKIYEEIYNIHSQRIVLGATTSHPVLVVFSAVPGSGKSELTKRLVENYGFSRIANKDIRWAIEEAGYSDDIAVAGYTLWLLDKLTKDEPLKIVFDRNIDQWYEAPRMWAFENNYEYRVVRIDVTREILEERLRVREGRHTAHVFSVLDFYIAQHEQQAKIIDAGVTLNNDYNLESAAAMIAEAMTDNRT